MDNVEFIKQTLTNFIEISQKSNQKFNLKDGTKINLNKAIYEIQHHFNEELKRLHINLRLNDSISSDSIIKSFDDRDTSPHKQQYYLFPFFNFISANYNFEKELNELIDEFLEKNKEQLSWPDIEITKTGGTRCKTNLRFCLNTMRDLTLITKKTKDSKRSMKPTILGQLVIIYFKWKQAQNPGGKLEEQISYNGFKYFFDNLFNLDNLNTLSSFLQYVSTKYDLPSAINSKIESYLYSFRSIILRNIQTSNGAFKLAEGIRDNEDYKKLTNELAKEDLFLLD